MRGHFGNVFVKPSAVFALLTSLLLFTAQKEKLLHTFPLKCFFLNISSLQMPEEKMPNWHILRRLRIVTPKRDCGTSLNKQRCNEKFLMSENIYQKVFLNRIIPTSETHAWRWEKSPKPAPLKRIKDPRTKT